MPLIRRVCSPLRESSIGIAMSTLVKPTRSPHKKHRRSKARPVVVPAENRSAISDQEQIFDSFSPSRLRWNNVDWVVLGWMVAMHAGCIAAPFFFTWQALGVAFGLWWLTASVGVCLGYH